MIEFEHIIKEIENKIKSWKEYAHRASTDELKLRMEGIVIGYQNSLHIINEHLIKKTYQCSWIKNTREKRIEHLGDCQDEDAYYLSCNKKQLMLGYASIGNPNGDEFILKGGDLTIPLDRFSHFMKKDVFDKTINVPKIEWLILTGQSDRWMK